jgi:2-polyprenyl-6-methoxyphenol hydroxylase-like FAD-dependent oxidoreductase
VRIAINGAGIAGTAAAFWLRRAGHDVVLVERAPALRAGGYIVDFWGLGYDIVERMGLIARVRELGYQIHEVRFVDDRGRTVGGFLADVFADATHGRFTSVRRSDIAGTMFDALDDGVERVFDDSIATIQDDGPRVHLTFDRSPPRDVDLVIGADGLHSRVRGLLFGDDDGVEIPLGYCVAAFEAEGYRPRDELVYVTHGVPGRQISRFAMRGDRTLFLCVFRDEFLPASLPGDEAGKRSTLRTVFKDVAWETPRILSVMDDAPEIYFDRVSQIRLPSWTKGRVALVGDAAACVSLLAGEGTGLAIAEAYVLAGELASSRGNVVEAFQRYESLLMPFLRRKQASASRFASTFAPRTATGIHLRNLISRLLGIRFVANYFIGRDLRDDLSLPQYDFDRSGAGPEGTLRAGLG